jgi:diguanylate cyclase (GGDEF)-like protein
MLELALARARRHELGVGVLFLDLDNFKLVNDSMGHHAGDDLLVQLAERLRACTRETDLVARQGGDEFLLLLSDLERGPVPDADKDAGVLVAESVAERASSRRSRSPSRCSERPSRPRRASASASTRTTPSTSPRS